MKIIEVRTMEIVCHNLPKIADALVRIATVMERQVNTDNTVNTNDKKEVK